MRSNGEVLKNKIGFSEIRVKLLNRRYVGEVDVVFEKFLF